MKSITLALGLLAGAALPSAALAQTPPAPKPPAAAPATPAPSAPSSAAQQSAQGNQPGTGTAQPATPAPSAPPEGMVVETPNGFYLVRPGQSAPRRLDLGQNDGDQQAVDQPGTDQPGSDQPRAGRSGPVMGEDADQDGMQAPPPPRSRRPRPPEGKGARFRIHGPNIDVSVKCPDDEPVKACIDAISQLMDKVNAAH